MCCARNAHPVNGAHPAGPAKPDSPMTSGGKPTAMYAALYFSRLMKKCVKLLVSRRDLPAVMVPLRQAGAKAPRKRFNEFWFVLAVFSPLRLSPDSVP